MTKSKRIDSFLERERFVIKMKKNASTLTKLMIWYDIITKDSDIFLNSTIMCVCFKQRK